MEPHRVNESKFCTVPPISSSRPRPISRAKKSLRWKIQIRCTIPIVSIEEDSVPPPTWENRTGVTDAEEDEDTTQCSACVQSSRQDVIVLSPPLKELLIDDSVEDEVDQRPGGVVDACSRRDIVSPNVDERPIDVAPELPPRFLLRDLPEPPRDDWS